MKSDARTILIRSFLASMLLLTTELWPSAASAEPTERMELKMVMYMAGLTAGTMKLSVDFNDVDVTSSLKLKSKGVVKMMTGYKGRSQARTTLLENGWPVPVTYDAAYETRKYDRKIEIRYSPDQGDIDDLRIWKRGELRNSKVPDTLWQSTIDPLTAVLHFRHWVLAMRDDPSAKKRQMFEVFDGRRRYRLNAEVIERDIINFGGEEQPAYRIKIILEPLAGFSSKDLLANWSSEDGSRWIELVITDDNNPVPLSLSTKGGTLKTSILLESICDRDNNCTAFDS